MSEAVTPPAVTTETPPPAPAATPPAPPAVAGNLLADAPPPADPAATLPAPAATEPPKPEPPKEPDAPKPRTPEEVTAGLKLPETMPATDPVVQAFIGLAAENGMTDAAAQALVDKMAPAITAELAKPYQAWADLQTSWQDTLRNDPEIGGEKLMPAMQKVQQAFNLVLGPDGAKALNEALKTTGGGNNPAIVKGFYKMAARLTEQGSGPVKGNPPAESKNAAALAKMYPSTVKAEA